MSIRIRNINGVTVALCAARSMPKEGDIYLDDAAHHALSIKFEMDFASMGFMAASYLGSEEVRLTEQEESNNPNRDWWECTYGTKSL